MPCGFLPFTMAHSPNTNDAIHSHQPTQASNHDPNPIYPKNQKKKKKKKKPPHTHTTLPKHPPHLRTNQRQPPHRLLKHLQRQRGLIVRHLVPGAKHPDEAEVARRLERAGLRPVDGVGRQGRGREGGLARVGDGVRGREPAEPVADPVGVAGPQDDADAALHDGGEGREEVAGVCFLGGGFLDQRLLCVEGGSVWMLTVTRRGELLVWGCRALCVLCLGSDGFGDSGLL